MTRFQDFLSLGIARRSPAMADRRGRDAAGMRAVARVADESRWIDRALIAGPCRRPRAAPPRRRSARRRHHGCSMTSGGTRVFINSEQSNPNIR